jgi:hypothetical protein
MDEFDTLTAEQQQAVEQVIGLARQHGDRHTKDLPDGSEAYAYPHRRGIAWGVNGGSFGFNIARGVREG